jgi:hypothetical protein
MLSEFEFKVTCNKIVLLHLIAAPQLSIGWQHNHSTKTRLSGLANEHMYSFMSMVLPPLVFSET